MSFVTLAGTPFPCMRDGGATELPPERGGTVGRTFNGSRRSTVRWEKRAWEFKSIPLLPADVATLKANVALGAQVTLSGDIVGGANVTVDVEFQDTPYLTGTGAPNGFYRLVTIRATEV